MKKYICTMFLFTFLMTNMGIFHCDGNESIQTICVKHYVGPEQIHIQEGEIQVEIQGEFIEVDSLAIDQTGIYAIQTIDQEARIPVGTWQCPSCLRLNSLRYTKCQFCGWPDKK